MQLTETPDSAARPANPPLISFPREFSAGVVASLLSGGTTFDQHVALEKQRTATTERDRQDRSRRDKDIREADAAAATAAPTTAEVAQEAERSMAAGSKSAREAANRAHQSKHAAREAQSSQHPAGEAGPQTRSGTPNPRSASPQTATGRSAPTATASPESNPQPSPSPAGPSSVAQQVETKSSAVNPPSLPPAASPPPGSPAAGAPAAPLVPPPATRAATPSAQPASAAPGVEAAMPARSESTATRAEPQTGPAVAARTASRAATANRAQHAAPRANDAQEDANVERIVRHLRAQLTHDRARTTLRLDPPELGQIRMQMELQRDQMRLVIDTQTHLAHHLLRETLDGLRAELAACGIHVQHLELRPPEPLPDEGSQGGLSDDGRQDTDVSSDEQEAHGGAAADDFGATTETGPMIETELEKTAAADGEEPISRQGWRRSAVEPRVNMWA